MQTKHGDFPLHSPNWSLPEGNRNDWATFWSGPLPAPMAWAIHILSWRVKRGRSVAVPTLRWIFNGMNSGINGTEWVFSIFFWGGVLSVYMILVNLQIPQLWWKSTCHHANTASFFVLSHLPLLQKHGSHLKLKFQATPVPSSSNIFQP